MSAKVCLNILMFGLLIWLYLRIDSRESSGQILSKISYHILDIQIYATWSTIIEGKLQIGVGIQTYASAALTVMFLF